MTSGFHAHDGWYFRRDEDGAVAIEACESAHVDAQPVMGLQVDADTWASIVASVSAKGGTSETFYAAKALHGGEAQTLLVTSDSYVPAGATAQYPTCPTCCTHDHGRA